MDKIDPICGMKGKIYAHNHYFCSEYCIRKYEEKYNISDDKKYCPTCLTRETTPWYKEKLFIVIFYFIVFAYIELFNHPFQSIFLCIH